ncbi:MAG TPA: DnaJ domain-containing protein [Abditibacterium sp.]
MSPYEVLGVQSDAEHASIRAAYRRLVRENHPDVASDKVAATTEMARINQAWQQLSDPEKRAAFDANVRWQERENEAAQERARFEAQRRARLERERVEIERARRGSASKKSKTSSDRKTKKRDDKARDAKNSGNKSKNLARETRILHKITLASRLFHREGRPEDAAQLCRSILLADGRNVPARELLSDILVFEGRMEGAIMLLDQAIQIAPQDRTLRRKRDQLQFAHAKSAEPDKNFAQAARRAVPKQVAPKKPPRISLLGRLRARFGMRNSK